MTGSEIIVSLIGQKQCTLCGVAKPLGDFPKTARRADGRGSWCKSCMAARVRALRAANPEKTREDERRRRETSPEKIRERLRRWRRANPEKVREHQRRYRQANPEKVRQQEQREPRRQKATRRRARVRKAVFDHYGWSCACCGGTTSLQIDHVTAFSGDAGGPRSGAALYAWLVKNSFPGGFQTLCRPCNRSKGDEDRCTLTH